MKAVQEFPNVPNCSRLVHELIKDQIMYGTNSWKNHEMALKWKWENSWNVPEICEFMNCPWKVIKNFSGSFSCQMYLNCSRLFHELTKDQTCIQNSWTVHGLLVGKINHRLHDFFFRFNALGVIYLYLYIYEQFMNFFNHFIMNSSWTVTYEELKKVRELFMNNLYPEHEVQMRQCVRMGKKYEQFINNFCSLFITVLSLNWSWIHYEHLTDIWHEKTLTNPYTEWVG